MNKKLHVPPLGRIQRPAAERLMLILLLLLCCPVHSALGGEPDGKSATWITLKTIDKVTIQYQQIYCQKQDLVVLKMINSNDHVVKVGWSLFGGHLLRNIALEKGETKSVDCDAPAREILSQIIPSGKTILDLNPSFYVR